MLLAVAVSVLALALLISTGAAPGEAKVARCIQASEKGQAARRNGQTLESLALLRRCASAECPALISADCSKAVAALERSLATLQVTAVDEKGLSVPEVVVTINGEVARGPTELMPGDHVVVVESPTQRVEKRVKLRAGARALRVVLPSSPPQTMAIVPTPSIDPDLPRTESEPAREREDDSPRRAEAERPTPVVEPSSPRVGPIVLGVAAVVALGLAAGLGISGFGDYQRLSTEPCAATRSCDPTREAPIRSLLLVADVSLIVGLLCGAGAVVWALVPPNAP